MTTQKPTDTESVVERVARAMFERDTTDDMFEDESGRSLPAPAWDSEIGREWQSRFRAMARAAIEAMREPTMAMQMAATGRGEDPGSMYAGIWSAMIDAALSEPLPEDGK